MTPAFSGLTGLDVARGAPEHLPRLLADGHQLTLAARHRHHRRLAQHDPLPLLIDQHVRGAQIDAQRRPEYAKPTPIMY